MVKNIFERQIAKLKHAKFVDDIKHFNDLIDADCYTEAFIAMWILVEIIAKDIQTTHRAAIAADKISGSLLNKLRDNNINIEINNLHNQLSDVAFIQVKNAQDAKWEKIKANDVILGLKLISPQMDEDMLMFLLSTKVDKTPAGFSSRTTIREKRNGVMHNKSRISKSELVNCKPYFDYFFSLTIRDINSN